MKNRALPGGRNAVGAGRRSVAALGEVCVVRRSVLILIWLGTSLVLALGTPTASGDDSAARGAACPQALPLTGNNSSDAERGKASLQFPATAAGVLALSGVVLVWQGRRENWGTAPRLPRA